MIKAVIFDFDDTLYVGSVWGNYRQYEKDLVLKLVKDEKIYDRMVEKYQIDKTDTIVQTMEICKKEGFSRNKFFRMIKHSVYQHPVNPIQIVSDEFLRQLSQKLPIYVVSMSNQTYLKHYFKKFDINKKYFRKIYSMHYLKDKDKSVKMLKVAKREHLATNEVLMVGYSLRHDILAAQNIGMQTFYFQGDYDQLFKFLTENNVLDCREFMKK